MKQTPEQGQQKNWPDRLVSYKDGDGDLVTGRLLFFSESMISPEFDLAYIDFDKYWRVALKSELVEPVPENELCPKCQKYRMADEFHLCPFKSEINEDKSKCRCCDTCRQNCADEI